MVLDQFRLHKSQRSCPNKLVNAKSKKHFEQTNGQTDGRTDEWTDGVTWSLLELLIAAKNEVLTKQLELGSAQLQLVVKFFICLIVSYIMLYFLG